MGGNGHSTRSFLNQEQGRLILKPNRPPPRSLCQSNLDTAAWKRINGFLRKGTSLPVEVLNRQNASQSSIQPISPIEFKAASTKSLPHSRHFEPPS